MTSRRALVRRVKWALTRARTASWKRTHDDASAEGLRVLLYHRVADDRDDPLAVPVEHFEAQMEHLARNGYQVLDVRTALDALRAGTLPPRAVALSFDDGFVDVAEHAAPTLARLDQRATVFIATRVSTGESSYQWYREQQPPVIPPPDVARLDSTSPLSFEAHTLTHPNLTTISDDDARREIAESRLELESILDRPVTVFCYPGGFFGARERRLAEEAGYAYATTCESGVNTAATDPFLLRRIQIEGTDSLTDFDAKLRGSHDRPLFGRQLYRRLRYPGLGDGGESGVVAVEGGDAERGGSSLATGSAFYFVAQVAANLGYFVAVLLLARGLPRAERGVVAFVTISALVMARVGPLGVGDASTVFASQHLRRRPSLVTNLLVFTGVSGVVGAVLAAAIVALAGARPAEVTDTQVLLFVVGAIANCYVNCGLNFLVGCGRVRLVAYVKAVPPWVYAFAVAGLYATGRLSATSAVGAWTTAHSLWALGLIALMVLTGGIGRLDLPYLWETIAYGVRLWLGSLSTFLNARVDQILMGFLVSEATLGTYAVAVNASEPLLILPASTALALLPALAIRHPEERGDVALVTVRMVLLLTAIGVAAFAAIGAPILVFVFGAQYQGARIPFLILLPGAFGYAYSIVLSRALMAMARPARSSLGPLVSVIVGTALDLVLIRPYGATGASVAATVAFLSGGIAMVIAYRRIHPFRWLELVPTGSDVARVGALTHAVRRRTRVAAARAGGRLW